MDLMASRAFPHVVLAVLLILCACKSAPSKITFEARAGNLRKPSNSYARNKGPDDLLVIGLPGKLIDPPAPLAPIDRSAADWSTPEHAAASILSATRAGNVPWMVENFVPQERETIGKQLADPAAVARLRDLYRRAGQVSITAAAEIRGYTVLFLLGRDEDGDPTFLNAVLSKTPTGWRQSNALAGDDAFDLATTAAQTAGVH